MRISLDIDGCIANFVYAFCTVAWEGFGIKAKWKEPWFDITQDQFREVYDYMIRHDIFKNIKPYEGAVEVVKSWVAQGHEIVYITRRRPGKDKSLKDLHENQTKKWIVNNHFPVGLVVFTGNKAAYCLEHDIPILIEDYYADAVKWNKLMLVYLVDRPWNQGDYPHRIKSLSEVELG